MNAHKGEKSMTVGIIACGALSIDIQEICDARGWNVKIYPLPPLLHNQPQKIAGEVETLLIDVGQTHHHMAIAYADCGTYGALDEVAHRYGLSRLGGAHCYDIFATKERISELMAEEAGTYFLTDFLVRSFHRSVIVELGLDRFPELRPDYFQHYRRIRWLAQKVTPELRALAEQAARSIDLPLEIEEVGRIGLERELAVLLCEPLPSKTLPSKTLLDKPLPDRDLRSI